jgi:hypothetical protein
MAPWFWVAQNWFELIQTLGITGGLAFTAYSFSKDDKSRKISNLIAIKQQHREIWRELFDRPKLMRVLKQDVNLSKEAITEEEALFVKFLFLHLAAVHRAKRAGMFVEIQGLDRDIQEFLLLPIPKVIWHRLKQFLDKDFVEFVEKV